MADRPTLYILDAYSLIFQVFHAIPEMTGPAGQPTSAVFGIFRDILNLRRDRKPDLIAAAFDGAGPVFRGEIDPSYKANRTAMPDDLVPQIPVIKRVFEGFRIPALTVPGMEADDIIATLARRAEREGYDVVILTNDKDARQLISDHVRLLNLRKNALMGAEELEKEWGIRPDQVVDFLSLTGDSVDNVKGVPGIGPGYASTFLKEFGTLDALLAGVDRVKGKKKQESLREFGAQARLARRLVELRDDLDLSVSWEEFTTKEPDREALLAICSENGFHGFRKELAGAEAGASAAALAPRADWKADYHLVDTRERFAAFLAALKQQPSFGFDTETTGLDPLRDQLVGLSFAWIEGEAYYLPVRGPAGSSVLEERATLDALAPILADPESEKIGQNCKFDILVLRRQGLTIGGPITDTMLLSYLLESGERNHNLDQLSERFLNHQMIPITDLIGKGKAQITFDQAPLDKAAEYAAEDADAAWRLGRILGDRVRSEGLWDLYAQVERPLIGVLARMEEAGIKVDVPLLETLSRDFAGKLEQLEAETYRIAGRAFNMGSPQQLRQILFEELKLPAREKTPGGEWSTSQEVLEELAATHPLPELILKHRQFSKLKNTYLDSLPKLVHADGRIHASFNQSVAATGRLSSSDPNLQNIPVRTDEGKQIRQAFIAGAPGWSLLTADYSQVELRILAHFSEDPALLQAFEQDRDIHRTVAARVFHVPEDAVDEGMRRAAKTVNFGVIYGLSAFGLASRLGIPQIEAAAFIEAYFKEYAGVDRFITQTLEEAKAAGRVETILGRRRPILGIKATTGRVRNLAERTAINTVIQGSAADLIKRAMINLDELLAARGFQARMLLQIHDELVLEAPAAEIPALAALVRQAMTTALELKTPLKVDLAFGPNWLDVEAIDPT